ncbi:MAG TPA: hypothetical protein ENN23_09125 [Deltaproteobacteria bacterium]|nr:hypothetical protein [Deltaproteobacteria bacterium]
MTSLLFMMERLNKQIKRRTRVGMVFPSEKSIPRLILYRGMIIYESCGM